MTFKDFRKRTIPCDARVYVIAVCVEYGTEAYSMLRDGPDVFDRAAQQWQRLQRP